MNEGVGSIRLNLAAEAVLDAAGKHKLSFRNDHLPELGVYPANALVPTTDAIKITGQERDVLQRGLQVNFQTTTSTIHDRRRWIGLSLLGLCLALYFFTASLSMRRNPE